MAKMPNPLPYYKTPHFPQAAKGTLVVGSPNDMMGVQPTAIVLKKSGDGRLVLVESLHTNSNQGSKLVGSPSESLVSGSTIPTELHTSTDKSLISNVGLKPKQEETSSPKFKENSNPTTRPLNHINASPVSGLVEPSGSALTTEISSSSATGPRHLKDSAEDISHPTIADQNSKEVFEEETSKGIMNSRPTATVLETPKYRTLMASLPETTDKVPKLFDSPDKTRNSNIGLTDNQWIPNSGSESPKEGTSTPELKERFHENSGPLNPTKNVPVDDLKTPPGPALMTELPSSSAAGRKHLHYPTEELSPPVLSNQDSEKFSGTGSSKSIINSQPTATILESKGDRNALASLPETSNKVSKVLNSLKDNPMSPTGAKEPPKTVLSTETPLISNEEMKPPQEEPSIPNLEDKLHESSGPLNPTNEGLVPEFQTPLVPALLAESPSSSASGAKPSPDSARSVLHPENHHSESSEAQGPDESLGNPKLDQEENINPERLISSQQQPEASIQQTHQPKGHTELSHEQDINSKLNEEINQPVIPHEKRIIPDFKIVGEYADHQPGFSKILAHHLQAEKEFRKLHENALGLSDEFMFKNYPRSFPDLASVRRQRYDSLQAKRAEAVKIGVIMDDASVALNIDKDYIEHSGKFKPDIIRLYEEGQSKLVESRESYKEAMQKITSGSHPTGKAEPNPEMLMNNEVFLEHLLPKGQWEKLAKAEIKYKKSFQVVEEHHLAVIKKARETYNPKKPVEENIRLWNKAVEEKISLLQKLPEGRSKSSEVLKKQAEEELIDTIKNKNLDLQTLVQELSISQKENRSAKKAYMKNLKLLGIRYRKWSQCSF